MKNLLLHSNVCILFFIVIILCHEKNKILANDDNDKNENNENNIQNIIKPFGTKKDNYHSKKEDKKYDDRKTESNPKNKERKKENHENNVNNKDKKEIEQLLSMLEKEQEKNKNNQKIKEKYELQNRKNDGNNNGNIEQLISFLEKEQDYKITKEEKYTKHFTNLNSDRETKNTIKNLQKNATFEIINSPNNQVVYNYYWSWWWILIWIAIWFTSIILTIILTYYCCFGNKQENISNTNNFDYRRSHSRYASYSVNNNDNDHSLQKKRYVYNRG